MTGSTPTATLTLTAAWKASANVTPEANKKPKRSGAERAIRNPRTQSNTKSPNTKSTPKSPSSSPITETMKSLYAEGR